MDNQKNIDNWLDKEEQTFGSKETNKTFEQLPSLRLVPEKDVEIDVDFSKPFNKWTDDSDIKKIVIKAIIPVTVDDVKMNWWLNIKNPVYAEIIRAGRKGTAHFKIHQEGKLKQTKYTIVK